MPASPATSGRRSRWCSPLSWQGSCFSAFALPSNDIWIAAQAMESGAELLSFDGHFAEIDGLAWVKPVEP